MRNNFLLFISAFIQMGLVAINTIFIIKENTPGLIITSFTISMLWSFNIRKISIGSMKQRVVYASGATVGTLLGYLIFK